MVTAHPGLNQVQAAAAIGVNPRAIRKAEKNRRISKPANGRYDPEKLKTELESSRIRVASDNFKRGGGRKKKSSGVVKPMGTESTESWTAERIKEKRSERELKELRLAIARKEVISRMTCEREAEETGTMVTEALETIVDRIASRLVAVTDELKIREMLLAEFDILRETLADRITTQFAG